MRVKDLIEELENFDPDSEVVFSYDYGDYWDTIVAAPAERIDQGFVTYSAYHQQDKVVEMRDDEMDSDGPVRNVVIISA
ncbi:MAG: hypothetical protein FJ211_09925 [Ignavibacteria bacterium]|nr:hypothetical protein [Ignavibacteria bacterium]